MLPAVRTSERPVGSVARRRSRGRMAGSSLAATTITSSVAGPCPRSSAWPHRRRIARPRWPRHQRRPLPGSGRGCARSACRARAGRSGTGYCSGRLGEASCRATGAGRHKTGSRGGATSIRSRMREPGQSSFFGIGPVLRRQQDLLLRIRLRRAQLGIHYRTPTRLVPKTGHCGVTKARQ